MKKTDYKKELVIKATQKRRGTNNNTKDVRKIQSWLSLYAITHPSAGTATGIDGDFGPATERAVKNYQKSKDIVPSGMVTQALFDQLCAPMKEAFETPLQSTHLRDLVLEVAQNHVNAHPRELIIKGQSNSGPWVRSYMDGKDGALWFWCMGFVQTIIDQAASEQGKKFTDLMPQTVSCDIVGDAGLKQGILHRNSQLKNNPSLIKPGDIFLIKKSRLDWTHTGIIIDIDGDTIETIEGNTNHQGSRNGVAAMKRTRNFRKSNIDTFSIEPLV